MHALADNHGVEPSLYVKPTLFHDKQHYVCSETTLY